MPKLVRQTPLAFLLATMRDETKPDDMRLQAAIAAAPYCHRRLYSIEHAGTMSTVTVDGAKVVRDDELDELH